MRPRALGPSDPERIGGYRLTGTLGEGGQGVVYLAEGPSGVRVAVKVLRDVDAESHRRFLREADTARRVAPFCTARVLDAGTADGRPYVVSEYIPGPSLAETVTSDGPRTGSGLQRLAVATLTALAAIHRAGVVHRDVKPANVILGPEGPVVIDFGIARDLGQGTTSTGLVGTPAYVSPELLAGHTPGTASDVFSWAATMVYAATGRTAFRGGNLTALLYAISTADPDLTGVPADLHPLLSASLAKDPTARPSATTLLRELTGDDTPLTTGPSLPATTLTPSPAPTGHPDPAAPPPHPGPAALPGPGPTARLTPSDRGHTTRFTESAPGPTAQFTGSAPGPTAQFTGSGPGPTAQFTESGPGRTSPVAPSGSGHTAPGPGPIAPVAPSGSAGTAPLDAATGPPASGAAPAVAGPRGPSARRRRLLWPAAAVVAAVLVTAVVLVVRPPWGTGPAAGKLLYADDFSERGNWDGYTFAPDAADDSRTTHGYEIDRGVYSIHADTTDPHGAAFSPVPPKGSATPERDVLIAVTARLKEGSASPGVLGLTCRWDEDVPHGYAFTLGLDGTARITRTTSGERLDVIPPAKLSPPAPGTDVRLQARCARSGTGVALTFWVDGSEALDAVDTEPPPETANSQVGLLTQVPEAGGGDLTVSFDDFTVHLPA
ncbi:protein kinase domain-containing protein [Sphaerisporangium rubeum]|uniref:Serine/threonine protein kinase n=3 Tax=Sphaerisporangium rubeum TaxID=321317 RepID=A0A7X0IF75_9ACTN|nr:serine/threonine protein kinase [Sphaerisporangium rubeum]